MDEFVKKESLELLSNVHATNPKTIEKISFLIRGDFPSYISCVKEDLKKERELNAKLQQRIQQLEKELIYKDIILNRIENELCFFKKCKGPVVNRLK